MRLPVRRGLVGLFIIIAISACGDDDTAVSNNQNRGDFDDLAVYNADSPYASSIAGCVSAQTDGQLCRLEELPLIGMETESPSIADIMDRVVVSHAWMGERFEEILENIPPEMLPVFRALTAVVIDDDIRPAYYTSQTGAIYLDPAFLWLSVAEKQTINTKQDHRSGYDDPLAFRAYSQYVMDGERVASVGSLTDNSTRQLDDIIYLISRLLLHELAHANDFFPPHTLDSLDLSDTAGSAASSVGGERISSRLTDNDPLTSSMLYSVGAVMYLGKTPSSADLAVTAEEVGEEFEADVAADNYAYASQYEDTAMLFEIAMMKYFFDIDYEMVFTDAPEDESFCQNYIIRWGQHGRIGDNDVKARAQFVVSELMPALQTELFFQEMPLPQAMATDVDLCSIFARPSGNTEINKPAAGIPMADFGIPYL